MAPRERGGCKTGQVMARVVCVIWVCSRSKWIFPVSPQDPVQQLMVSRMTLLAVPHYWCTFQIPCKRVSYLSGTLETDLRKLQHPMQILLIFLLPRANLR